MQADRRRLQQIGRLFETIWIIWKSWTECCWLWVIDLHVHFSIQKNIESCSTWHRSNFMQRRWFSFWENETTKYKSVGPVYKWKNKTHKHTHWKMPIFLTVFSSRSIVGCTNQIEAKLSTMAILALICRSQKHCAF